MPQKTHKFSDLRKKRMERPGAAEKLQAARDRLQTRLARHAATLAEIRRAREITQNELAQYLQSTQPEVSRIEKTTRLTSFNHAVLC